jgi:hypothetical protein
MEFTMRRFPALPLLACLGACSNLTPTQQAQITQAVTVACNVDGTLVPVAQPVVATLGPGGAQAATVDALLVHPAVVAACAALKGTPASAAPIGATAVATPAGTPTPTTN